MKASLIKIISEQDLFYDSEDKLYRFRMHCPNCGKESGCRCFETLEKAEDFMEFNFVEFVCSSRCALMDYMDEYNIHDVEDTMKEMGLIWRLKWYIFRFTGRISEDDAYKVLDVMDLDYDSVEGELC